MAIGSLRPSIDIESLKSILVNADLANSLARFPIQEPLAPKSPPAFNTRRLADICGLTVKQVQYLARTSGLPNGNVLASFRKSWNLGEVQQWVRFTKPGSLRNPEMQGCVTLCVPGFDGRNTASTTATLAHGLSILGHRVLVVDANPNGHLTRIFGVNPAAMANAGTLLSLFDGSFDTALGLVKSTYWSAVDIVPASTSLFAADPTLRKRYESDQEFRYWRVLDTGLDEVRDVYDIIIINTPASMDLLTVNSLFSAEAIVMPLSLTAAHFKASLDFWSLFTEICTSLHGFGESKVFSFVDIVLSKTGATDEISDLEQLISDVYGVASVLLIETVDLSRLKSFDSMLKTVYDLDATRGAPQAKDLNRTVDAMDELVASIALQIAEIWRHDTEIYSAHRKRIAEKQLLTSKFDDSDAEKGVIEA